MVIIFEVIQAGPRHTKQNEERSYEQSEPEITSSQAV